MVLQFGVFDHIEPVPGLQLQQIDRQRLAQIDRPWEQYRWNLGAPRRLEAERRGLQQFLQSPDGSFGFVGERPKGLPAREPRRDISAEIERFDQQKHRENPNRLGGVALAGSPRAVREYQEEYLATRGQLLCLLLSMGRSDA